MANFSGTLSINGDSSFLMPQDSWLLMDGYGDDRQAGIEATRFIKDVKGLQSAPR